MIVVDRNAIRMLELACAVSSNAELGHERAIVAREYLQSAVDCINDEQETSMMVEHEASRSMELAIGIASFLGTDRELDSSIGIKRMIAHLPKISLSLSQRQELMHERDEICKRDWEPRSKRM